MEWDAPRDLVLVHGNRLTLMASCLNWILQGSSTPLGNGEEKGPHYRLIKQPGWTAGVAEFQSSNFLESASDISDAFTRSGASIIAALSIPFYLADGSLYGYESKVRPEAIKEIAVKWAPFEYVIAGFSESLRLKSMIFSTAADFAMFVGPAEFVHACLPDMIGSEAAFEGFASDEKRTDLKNVLTAVSRYRSISDDMFVLFPCG